MDYKSKILAGLDVRGLGKTICPSEVLAPEEKKDKAKMKLVRAAAQELILEGIIVATQKGKIIDLETVVGPIRLSRKVKGSHE